VKRLWPPSTLSGKVIFPPVMKLSSFSRCGPEKSLVLFFLTGSSAFFSLGVEVVLPKVHPSLLFFFLIYLSDPGFSHACLSLCGFVKVVSPFFHYLDAFSPPFLCFFDRQATAATESRAHVPPFPDNTGVRVSFPANRGEVFISPFSLFGFPWSQVCTSISCSIGPLHMDKTGLTGSNSSPFFFPTRSSLGGFSLFFPLLELQSAVGEQLFLPPSNNFFPWAFFLFCHPREAVLLFPLFFSVPSHLYGIWM